MYNHNKAQQSKNRVHISWDILYVYPVYYIFQTIVVYKTFTIFSVDVYAPRWILYHTAALVPRESITISCLTVMNKYVALFDQYIWYEWVDPAGLRLMSERSGVIPGNLLLCPMLHPKYHINGLVQYCSNSSALPMELLQSCAKPLTCFQIIYIVCEPCTFIQLRHMVQDEYSMVVLLLYHLNSSPDPSLQSVRNKHFVL